MKVNSKGMNNSQKTMNTNIIWHTARCGGRAAPPPRFSRVAESALGCSEPRLSGDHVADDGQNNKEGDDKKWIVTDKCRNTKYMHK